MKIVAKMILAACILSVNLMALATTALPAKKTPVPAQTAVLAAGAHVNAGSTLATGKPPITSTPQLGSHNNSMLGEEEHEGDYMDDGSDDDETPDGPEEECEPTDKSCG